MSLQHPDSAHLLNSRRNRVGLTTNSKSLMQFAAELVDEIDQGRVRRMPSDQLSECLDTMVCILLDLLSAVEADENLWIGYSRGKGNYTSGGCYWDEASQTPLLSYTYYLNCIKLLDERGFIKNKTAKAGLSRFSSRMKATPKLHEYFISSGFNWSVIKTESFASAIIVKDENKRPVGWPDPGTFDLIQAIKNLHRINENLNSTFLNLCISDDELLYLNKTRHTTPDEEESEEALHNPVDFSWRKLQRVFAMSSFTNGGRFYGGWWQGVPSAFRKYIEIDGAVTVELDYSTIQPRILYASIGSQPPDDSYVLPEWGIEFRQVVKKAFSQLLNSDQSSRNPNQWHRFAPSMDPDPLPEAWSSMNRFERDKLRRKFFQERSGRDYSELLTDLLVYHEPIAKDFFSGVWGATQNLDSQIVERVLIKMLDEPVPLTVLPIHDSFIVRRGGEEQLRKAMIDSFNEVIMTNVKIDKDETVFDLPPGYENKGIIKVDKEFVAETKDYLKSHSKYFIREE